MRVKESDCTIHCVGQSISLCSCVLPSTRPPVRSAGRRQTEISWAVCPCNASISQSVCFSVCLSIHLSICQSIQLSFLLSVCPPVCSFISLSDHHSIGDPTNCLPGLRQRLLLTVTGDCSCLGFVCYFLFV